MSLGEYRELFCWDDPKLPGSTCLRDNSIRSPRVCLKQDGAPGHPQKQQLGSRLQRAPGLTAETGSQGEEKEPSIRVYRTANEGWRVAGDGSEETGC